MYLLICIIIFLFVYIVFINSLFFFLVYSVLVIFVQVKLN